MKRVVLLLAAAFTAIALQSSFGGIGVTAKIGTTGYGADVTIGLVPRVLNARVGLALLDYEYDWSNDDQFSDVKDLTVNLNFRTVPVLIDVHPFGEYFRISGGIVLNNNEIRGVATAGDTIELNGTDYSLNSLHGKISFDRVSPYIGIGAGNAADRSRRVRFAMDVGIMFQGSPKIEAHAVASDPTLQAIINADLEQERSELESDLDDPLLGLYPVMSLGISFTF